MNYCPDSAMTLALNDALDKNSNTVLGFFVDFFKKKLTQNLNTF